MISNYLLTIYRVTARHKLYAALNIFGLAIGIAVFLVLALFVRFETGFDRWIPKADNIYRLDGTTTFPGRAPDATSRASSAILPLMRMRYPTIIASVRLSPEWNGVPVSSGADVETEKVDYVDPDFFSVFDLPLAAGNGQAALSRPDGLVITQAIATKYFGAKSPLWRTLTLWRHGVPQLYRIAAVLKDLPSNTHLDLAILAPFTSAQRTELAGANILEPNTFTYLKFSNRSDAQRVSADLARFLQSHPVREPMPIRFGLKLEALPALHFVDSRLMFTMKPGGDLRLVSSLGALGLLTLAVAALNYVNLATARASLRAREIAVRKVLGATRSELVVQLLAEAAFTATFATLVGVALAELILPWVCAVSGEPLAITYLGPEGVLSWLIAVIAIVGAGAGLYPAVLISNFRARDVLASSRAPGGRRLDAQIRALLTSVQFTVAVTFTIATLAMGAEVRLIQNQDRGFHRDGLILVDSFQREELASRQAIVLAAFRNLPGVVSATAVILEPGMLNQLVWPDVHRPGVKGTSLTGDIVGEDYLTTYGAGLVAGRMFDRAHRLDESFSRVVGAPVIPKGANVVLNVRGAAALGFSNPNAAVGKTISINGTLVTVIGVIRDIRFGPPQQPIPPIVYLHTTGENMDGTGVVRFNGVSEGQMMARLKTSWDRLVPNAPFEAKSAEAALRKFYAPEEQKDWLFGLGSGVAVAISCIGLFGLATSAAERRNREIGIRKTLGASTGSVLRLLIGQFLRPVLFANLVAWPLAYVALTSWLSGFDQRIVLGPQYFIAGSVLAILVAGMTVLGQALRAASEPPARALRHE